MMLRMISFYLICEVSCQFLLTAGTTDRLFSWSTAIRTTTRFTASYTSLAAVTVICWCGQLFTYKLFKWSRRLPALTTFWN